MATLHDMAAKFQIDARNLSGKAASDFLARAAIAKKDELIASGKASPTYTKAVDGRSGADEFSVKPDGVIFYRFNNLPDVARYTLEAARGRYSFMGIRQGNDWGHYRDSFFIAVNGVVFKPEWYDDIPAEAELILCNFAPYARKLDVGIAGGKTMRLSVPPGIMDDVAALVNMRFGNSVKARRVWNIDFNRDRYVLVGNRKTGRGAGEPVQSPAVVISSRGM